MNGAPIGGRTLAPPATSPAPSHDTEQEHETEDVPDSPDTEPRRERLNIRIPGRYHPSAPQPQQQLSPYRHRMTPRNLQPAYSATRTMTRPSMSAAFTRSTRSGFVHNAGGSGALLAFGAFGGLEPAFAPTPTTPDPQTTREELRAPDANDWMAAMDADIDNIRRLNVFKVVPRPNGKSIIAPKWVFRRKYENGLLTKRKARFVARGFTQVPGVNHCGAHIYAPVVRLESFRALISIAALFDHDLR